MCSGRRKRPAAAAPCYDERMPEAPEALAARASAWVRARLERFTVRLITLQTGGFGGPGHKFPGSPAATPSRAAQRGPWLLLAIALATVVLSGFAASRLKLKTSFGELLPQ